MDPMRRGHLDGLEQAMATHQLRHVFAVRCVGGHRIGFVQRADGDRFDGGAVRQTRFGHVVDVGADQRLQHAPRRVDVDRRVVRGGANNVRGAEALGHHQTSAKDVGVGTAHHRHALSDGHRRQRVVFTIRGGRQDDGRCSARLQAVEAARENRTAADERQRFPRKPARREPRLQHDDRRSPHATVSTAMAAGRAGLRRPVAGSASRNTDSS